MCSPHRDSTENLSFGCQSVSCYLLHYALAFDSLPSSFGFRESLLGWFLTKTNCFYVTTRLYCFCGILSSFQNRKHMPWLMGLGHANSAVGGNQSRTQLLSFPHTIPSISMEHNPSWKHLNMSRWKFYSSKKWPFSGFVYQILCSLKRYWIYKILLHISFFL